MRSSIVSLIMVFGVVAIVNAQQSITFVHDSLDRQVVLFVPDDLPDDAPLVFVLHGYTGSAKRAIDNYGMIEIAEKEGFAVCYPEGSRDKLGITHWNANMTMSDIDDIGFLTRLADYLQQEYALSPDKTFVCGLSNGGFMAYTLACSRPDVFRAIASVAGTMSGYDWRNCSPEIPVPVLRISGTADNLVPIDGSLTPLGGWGGAPDIESITEFWASVNQCQDVTTAEINAECPSYITYHKNGISGNEVHQYVIKGWGHKWPTESSEAEFSASQRIWNFFENSTLSNPADQASSQ